MHKSFNSTFFDVLQFVSRHRLRTSHRPLSVALILYAISYVSVVAGTGLSFILEPVAPDELPVNRVDKSSVDAVAAQEVAAVAEPAIVKVVPPKPEPISKMTFVNDRDLLAAIADNLYAHYGLEGELRISLQRDWDGVRVPSENWTLNIIGLPANGIKSRIILKFEVIEGNITMGQWQLPIRCELWQDVLTSTRRISNGVEPLASDFEIQQVNVLRLNDNPVPVDIDLSKYVMKRAIGNSRPLLWQNIEQKPLVRKGQVVEVIASEGALHISMKGIALEDGLLNDFISIRNLTSKKSIDAQIIDEKHVKVYF